MAVLDVRETITSISFPPPTTPAVAVANLNFGYLLRGLPVQQVGTIHFATFLAPPNNPVSFPEIVGRPTDVFRGIPQGATLDALGGYTAPSPAL